MLIPIFLGVTLILFALLYMLVGSSIRHMPSYGGGDALDSFFAYLNAGNSFITRYIRYCYNILTKFDFGRSGYTKLYVTFELRYRIRNTLLLLLSGVGATLIVGIPAGVYAAVHKDGKRDRIINIITMFFSSIPSYSIAIVIVLLLAVYWRLLPVISSYNSPQAFIMPTLTVSIGGIASVIRMTRTSMLEELEKPYITALRAKGLKENSVVYRHALKNAMVPIVSTISTLISQLLFGTIVVEYFFNVPGIGTLMLRGVEMRDDTSILGCAVVLAVFITILNIVTDVLYMNVNPQIKVRYSTLRGRTAA